MPAASHDFEIEQGATLLKTVTWKDDNGTPINLTGCTARLQARSSTSSPTVLIDLTTENGGIVITPLTGTLTLNMTATQTAALAFKRAKYDLEVVDAAGFVTRLLQGSISVSPEVTK